MARTKIALIKVENVLSKGAAEGPPLSPGLALLRMLSTEHEPMFLTEDRDHGRVREWLMVECGLRRSPKILGPQQEDPVRAVRYLGYDLSYYVDSDPAACAYAMEQGVVALLACMPAYQRPEFRPDARGPVRRWDQLVEELEHQERLRLEDPRTDVDVTEAIFGD